MFTSVFEAWYVKQHLEVSRLPADWLPQTFAASTFYNGLAAILAGVAANVATDSLGTVDHF